MPIECVAFSMVEGLWVLIYDTSIYIYQINIHFVYVASYYCRRHYRQTIGVWVLCSAHALVYSRYRNERGRWLMTVLFEYMRVVAVGLWILKVDVESLVGTR